MHRSGFSLRLLRPRAGEAGEYGVRRSELPLRLLRPRAGEVTDRRLRPRSTHLRLRRPRAGEAGEYDALRSELPLRLLRPRAGEAEEHGAAVRVSFDVLTAGKFCIVSKAPAAFCAAGALLYAAGNGFLRKKRTFLQNVRESC